MYVCCIVSKYMLELERDTMLFYKWQSKENKTYFTCITDILSVGKLWCGGGASTDDGYGDVKAVFMWFLLRWRKYHISIHHLLFTQPKESTNLPFLTFRVFQQPTLYSFAYHSTAQLILKRCKIHVSNALNVKCKPINIISRIVFCWIEFKSQYPYKI